MRHYYPIMFTKLFAESGLSLDRLRSLLEVGASGSIVKAADGDPVRQSQYSRQIKELEDFFRIKLIERQGKGTRLTQSGKELARISRFFMLGLSNFQRGCLAEAQAFSVGGSATFIRQFLLPVVSDSAVLRRGTRYLVETANDDEIERRLHDLTLDFGVTARAAISRPLQLTALGRWRLKLWVPHALHRDEKTARVAFKERRLPLILARREFDPSGLEFLGGYEPSLTCDNFLEARAAMEQNAVAAILPDFLMPGGSARGYFPVRIPPLESRVFQFRLAWNPRLLRLNPHAIRHRDFLGTMLSKQMAE
jgi:DNA-binding transcriptional LysR family regulator